MDATDASPVIGIDLGGTHLQAGVVDHTGTILHRIGAYTHAQKGPEAVLDAVAEAARACAAGAGLGLEQIGALGFAAPGAIDFEAGTVIDAPNLGWAHLPVTAPLSERLGGMPVALENDVNAAALGEAKHGAGRGAQDALAIWVGTGVGGGIVINGRVFRGPMGTAGEIGQTLIVPTLTEVDEARMERHASRGFITRAIVDEFRTRADAEEHWIGKICAERRPTADELARAYSAGDAVVVRHIDRATDRLGVSVANAITLLGIPLVLLGGGLAESLPPSYSERLVKAIRAAVFPPACAGRVEVRVTTLKDNAGLMGAALTAQQMLKSAPA